MELIDEIDLIEIELIERTLAIKKAQTRFVHFVEYVAVDESNPYSYEFNWHLYQMMDAMDDWAFRKGSFEKVKNLAMIAPPRHGKTELVRYLIAYIFGRNPSAQILYATHDETLAINDVSLKIQNIMTSQKYKEVFGQRIWEVGMSSVDENTGKEIVSKSSKTRQGSIFKIFTDEFGRGSFECVGVSAGIAGKGFDYGFLDDMFGKLDDANSPTIRLARKNWFWNDFYSRKNSPMSRVLSIGARYHDEDVIGDFVVRSEEESPDWICYIYESKRSGKYGKMFEHDKREIGEYLWKRQADIVRGIEHKKKIFEVLWQQDTKPDKGEVFDVGTINWIDDFDLFLKKNGKDQDEEKFDHAVISVDCAFKDEKTSSYVSFSYMIKVNGKYVAIDIFRKHLTFSQTVYYLVEFCLKYDAMYEAILIEDKANGVAIINLFREKLVRNIAPRSDLLTIKKVIAFDPGKMSKYQRAMAFESIISEGIFFLPEKGTDPFGIGKSLWFQDALISEMKSYTGRKKDQADQIDTLAQAYYYLKDKSNRSGSGLIRQIDVQKIQQTQKRSKLVQKRRNRIRWV